MGCSHEWGELLSKFVDGETADDEKSRLEEHLRGCDGCRDLLSIFQRNENMLDNALTGEAFGSNIIEGVMAELRREEEPTVLAPALEEAPVSSRARWIPIGLGIAAAAAIMLSMIALVMPRGIDDDTRRELSSIRKSNETLQRALGDVRIMSDLTSRQFVDQITDQNREILTLRAVQQASVGETYGILQPRRGILVGIRVRDMSIFRQFDLQRSEHAKGDWKTITTGLLYPSYTDNTLTPGVSYDYRFIGTRRDGAKDEPMPPVTNVRVEAGEMSDPAKMVDITFVGCTPALDQATFRMTRRVGDQDYSRLINVKTGEMIGGRFSFGELEIDFSTGLMLQSMAEGDEVTYITLGSAAQSISRRNVRADLKAIGASATRPLFRGSSTWAAAP